MLKKWDPKRGQQEAGIMDQRVTSDFLFFTLKKVENFGSGLPLISLTL